MSENGRDFPYLFDVYLYWTSGLKDRCTGMTCLSDVSRHSTEGFSSLYQLWTGVRGHSRDL